MALANNISEWKYGSINTEFTTPSKETISEEYDQLEQVPPAPGDSLGQHDAMVKQGLCEKAVKKKNQSKNRYCNLYPFDKYIFNFEDPDQYINASWVKILPWFPTKRLKIFCIYLRKNNIDELSYLLDLLQQWHPWNQMEKILQTQDLIFGK